MNLNALPSSASAPRLRAWRAGFALSAASALAMSAAAQTRIITGSVVNNPQNAQLNVSTLNSSNSFYTVTGTPGAVQVELHINSSVSGSSAVVDGGGTVNYNVTNASGSTVRSTAASGAGIFFSTTGAGITTVVNRGTIAGGSSAAGININASVASVTNTGSITGGTRGMQLSKGGTIVNGLGGTVSGGTDGISGSGATTLANLGAIAGTTGYGIQVLGSGAGTVVNGALADGSNATTGASITGAMDAVRLQGTGSAVRNLAGNTITSTGAAYAGVLLEGGNATVDNAGGIQGVANGVRLSVGGTVTNAGTITGTSKAANQGNGVLFFGSDGKLVNQVGGSITGAGTNGVLFYGDAAAGSARIENAGAILGGQNGVQLGRLDGATAKGTGGTLINTGRIDGVANNGVLVVSGTAAVDNQAGGRIIGGGANGVQFGVNVASSSSVANAGFISGKNSGIALQSGGSVTNGPGAEIWSVGSGAIGNFNGITVENASGTVTNSGLVASNSGNGALFAAGGALTNDAADSVVRGQLDGVRILGGGQVEHQAGQIVGVTGAGVAAGGGVQVASSALIQGATDAVRFIDGDNTLSLRANSRTVGVVRMGAGNDRTIVQSGADISPVPSFLGGSGASLLRFDGYAGAVPGSIQSWAQVEAVGGANVALASAQTYQAQLFRTDPGATFGFAGNAGTLDGNVLNGGTLNYAAGDGTGRYRVSGVLTNAGRIELASAAGVPGNLLAVSSLVGQGGILSMRTVLGADGSASDRLVVDGGSATGTSILSIANAGGAGALTVANGIQVVDAVNGGTTAAGAFVLGGRAVAGAYEYQLFRGSADASNPDAWYLRSEQSTVPPAPAPAPGPGPAPLPSRPLYRPEVGAYLSNQRQAGGMFVHSLHDRLGDPQWAETQKADGERARSGWLRVVGKDGHSDSRDGNFSVDTTSSLVQGGLELARWSVFKAADAASPDRLHLGLMLGWGSASSEAGAAGNPSRAKGKTEGWSVGGYGTWYQNDDDPQKLGWYADLWGQYGRHDNSVRGDQLPEVRYHARSLVLSGEAGYAKRVKEDSDWIVEPQAQVVYLKYREDSIVEPNGTAVGGGDGSGWMGRLGLRTHRTWAIGDGRKVQPYLTLNWWHDRVDNAIRFNQLALDGLTPKNRYEVKLGVNAELDKGWSAWGNLGYQWGRQGYRNLSARIGAKYSW